MQVRVRMNQSALRALSRATVVALEQTVEAVKTDVIAKNVMPFGETKKVSERVYGKRGQFAKNGREYKGKEVIKTVYSGGTMQNESTSIDTTSSKLGRVSIVVDTPYARRLYYHPEYNFYKGANPNAQGRWFDLWIDGQYKDFAGRVFTELYRRQTGGYLR